LAEAEQGPVGIIGLVGKSVRFLLSWDFTNKACNLMEFLMVVPRSLPELVEISSLIVGFVADI
jgi:hypothetical protein